MRTSAFSVASNLTLRNNTFDHVDSHGFVLHDMHSVVLVDGNRFGRLEPEAFYESPAVGGQLSAATWLELKVRDNVFRQSDANRSWWPAVRLRTAVNTTWTVTGNRFAAPCDCGRWRPVTVDAGDYDEAAADRAFAGDNYCRVDADRAFCADNSTTFGADTDRLIGEFRVAAGCAERTADFERCVLVRNSNGGSGGIAGVGVGHFGWLGGESGMISMLVLLVLCGFGAVCAVSAITWLNARGYFIKLRSLLTSGGRGQRDGNGNGRRDGGGCGSGGDLARTISAHSLSPVSLHEYAELQKKNNYDRADRGANLRNGVRVVVYQDKGTQTVPEELTHEMLQTLRDKLDDPEDYAEARGMIEHLYDLIRVEETCSGGGNWYGTGGLDDMTSTMTTKAVTVWNDDGGDLLRDRDTRSVGTSAPSLERLWPAKLGNVPIRRETRPPPPPVSDYVDPCDFLSDRDDEDDDYGDADIYCELADTAADDGRRDQRPPQPPPPLPPDKPNVSRV